MQCIHSLTGLCVRVTGVIGFMCMLPRGNMSIEYPVRKIKEKEN